MRPKTFPHLGFRVSYSGASFRGFQKQKNSHSIQAAIEKALSIFFQQSVSISFTSRTDTGVHAFDQWIVINDGWSLYDSLGAVQKQRALISLNALLGDSICFWEILRLRADFHPKRTIEWKEYEYYVHWGLAEDPLARDRKLWVRGNLDIHQMKKCLKQIIGSHDFAGFAKTQSARGKKDTIRTLLKAELIVKKHSFLEGCFDLRFRFRGKGFLHHMVRNLVGTIIEVGRHKNFDMAGILSSRRRIDAGRTAVPHPLVLVRTRVLPKYFRKIQNAAPRSSAR